MEYLEINEHNAQSILELFHKEIDSDGFIIEKKNQKRLKCPYTDEEIKASNFSILPGSATFVNNKFYSFAEHRSKHL